MTSGRIPEELVTEETWDDYLDGISGWDTYMGYLHCNKHLITWLDKTLETAKNFEELRAQLLNLRNERQNFHDFARKNLPGSA